LKKKSVPNPKQSKTNEERSQEMRDYAFWLLGARMYSVGILREKMQMKFPEDEEEIKVILGRLKELNYLNDEEYARAFVRQRCEMKPSGKYKLAMELRLKKIAKEVYAPVLEELNEVELCRKAMEQKSRVLKKADRLKMMRFLVSRGFGYEIIKEVLEK